MNAVIRFVLSILVIGVLFLQGCGGSNTHPSGNVILLSGSVQKGLFTHLSVRALAVDPLTGVVDTSRTVTATTVGSEYSLALPSKGTYVLEAKGRFVNEVTGEPLTLDTTLESLVTIDEPLPTIDNNINLFTHIYTQQVFARVSAGTPLNQAQAQARRFVINNLGFNADIDFAALDITGIEEDTPITDPNLQLLLFSAATLRHIEPTGRIESWGEVVDTLSIASDDDRMQSALSALSGTGAESNYRLVQDTLELPPLSLFEGTHPVFLCPEGGACRWLVLDKPTVSLVSRAALEADGHAIIRAELSGPSQSSVVLRVQSVDQGATAGEDYVPLTKTVIIPAGETEASILVNFLLDNKEESSEAVAITLISDSASHDVANSTASIRLVDGVGTASHRLVDHVKFAEFCLTGFGSGTTLPNEACMEDESDILVGSSQATLGIRLGMAEDCRGRVNCLPTDRDWGAEFILEALSSEIPDTVASSLVFAQYRYRGENLWSDDGDGEVQLLQAHLSEEFIDLVDSAKEKGQAIRVRARLIGYERVVAIASLQPPMVLPGTLTAGDAEIRYHVTQLTQSEGGIHSRCREGFYRLSGDFSIDGVTTHASTVCVDISDDRQSAHLISGTIPLGGERVELAPFHNAFIRPLTQERPFMMGAPRIILPFDSGLSATNDVYLHADGLPFAFRVTGARVTALGIVLDYDGIYFLHYQGIDNPPMDIASNDIMYSSLHSKNQSGSLQLTSQGINTTVTVPRGDEGAYAYPLGQVSWEAFVIEIINGRIDPGALVRLSAIQFAMAQNSDCPTEHCGGAPRSTHRVNGEAVMDGKGAIVSHAQVSQSSSVHWGGHEQSNASAIMRPDDMTTGDQIVLALPGYQVEGTANDVGMDSWLNGHLRHQEGAVARYPLGSDDAVEGNYWPTGMSVGPEWYARLEEGALPDTGQGRSLSASPVRINNGSDSPYVFPVSDGAKYVLRNAGITGVFNIAPHALNNPIAFFGYDMQFDRFAFRAIDNRLDDYSWIDGVLRLPGHADVAGTTAISNEFAGAAGFTIPFSSLALNCRGRFDDGHVVLNEGPLPKAEAWNADTDIYHMGFATENVSDSDACSSEPQLVTLDQTLHMHALNSPLKAVNVQWYPDGAIGASDLLANEDYILDSQEAFSGFGVDVNDGRLATLRPASSDTERLYGVAKLDAADVATYFWQAPSVDIRLRNTPHGAERTVITASGTMDSGDTLDNTAFNLVENRQFDVTARRQWGDTFGFALPTYYTSGDAVSPPAFVGRYQTSDIVVLEAGAGIDYIRPDETKLSFGISADIAKVKELPLSIDLSNATSIHRLDGLLEDVGLGSVDLTSLLEPMQQRLQRINALSGAAIEPAIHRKVSLLMDRVAGNDLAQLSASLTGLSSMGGRLSAMANNTVTDDLSALQRWEAQLYEGMQNLYQGLALVDQATTPAEKSAQVEQVVLQAVGLKTQVLPNVLRSSVALQTGLLQHSDRLDSALVTLQNDMTQLRSVLNRLAGDAGTLSLMLQLDEVACQRGELSADQGLHLQPVLALQEDLSGLLNRFTDLSISSQLAPLVVGTPELAELLQRAEQRIRSLSQGLVSDWNEGISGFRGAICSEPVESYRAAIDEYLLSNEQGTGLLQQLEGLDERMILIQQVLTVRAQTTAGQLHFIPQYVAVLEQIIDGTIAEIYAAISRYPEQPFVAEEILAVTNASVLELTGNAGFPLALTTLYAAPDSNDSDFRTAVFTPVEQAVLQYQRVFSDTVEAGIGNVVTGQFTPAQLTQFLVGRVMNTSAMASVTHQTQLFTHPFVSEISQLSMRLTDQINGIAKQALVSTLPEAASVINAAEGTLSNVPLATGRVDGFARLNAYGLEQLHITADWAMEADVPDISGPRFSAALDVLAFQGEGDDAPCHAGPGDMGFDVSITAQDVTANILGTNTVFDDVALHFVLSESDGPTAYLPTGIGGGIRLTEPTDYEGFTLYNFDFDASIGEAEAYLGVGGLGAFDGSEMGLNVFLGRTCDDTRVSGIDPAAATLLPFNGDPFLGVYLRGELTAPFISMGCALDVSFRGSAGAWITAEPFVETGGIIGGGALGSIACLGSVRGQLDTAISADSQGDIYYAGRAFVVGGAGFDCDRGSWTSAGRSRGDDWCGTADVSVDVRYQHNQWHADADRPSGIH